MSCQLKADLQKKYGKDKGISLYSRVYTSDSIKYFGDFTTGAAKDTAQIKDGVPTLKAFEEYLEKRDIDPTQEKKFLDRINRFNAPTPESVRKQLLTETQILVNRVSKDAQTLQDNFESGNVKTDELRNQKIKLRNEANALLDKLKKKTAQASLIDYVSTVKRLIRSINDQLENPDIKAKLELSQLHEFIQRLTYFNSIEDVVSVINKKENKDLRKIFNENESVKDYNLISSGINLVKDKIVEAYVDIIGETWGKVPGKAHAIARREFRDKFDAKTKWLKNNPGSNKNDYEKAINSFVESNMERNKEEIDERQKQFLKNSLINQAVDISFLDSFVGNPRDLTDDIIQIAVEILDAADYRVMRETINRTKEGYDLYQKFIKGKSTTDMKSLYKDLLEKDEEGKITPYLIGPYKSSFYKEKKKFADAAADENNTKAQLEYKAWKKRNIINNKPIDKWRNPEYKFFEDKNNKGDIKYDMYQFLKSLAIKRDQNYFGRGAGLRLPYVDKSGLEDAFEDGVVTWAKNIKSDFLRARSTDIDLHKEGKDQEEVETWGLYKKQINILVDESQAELKSVPKYFRGYKSGVDESRQSYDLMSIYLMDYWGSLNFREKNNVLADLEVFKYSLSKRDVIQKTFFGQQKVDAKVNVPLVQKGAQSNSYKALQSLIEDRIYGNRAIGSERMQMLANRIVSYTGNLYLMGNYFSAGASVFQGKTMTFIESVGGVDFNKKDVLFAEAKYDTDVINIMGDVGKIVPSSKTNLLGERFESTQDFSAVAQKFAAATKGSQLLKMNTLHFFTNAGEHYIQNTLMYTILNSIKALNSKGEYINKNGEVVKDRKDAMTLDEAYEIDKGKKGDKAPVLKLNKNVASIEFKTGRTLKMDPKNIRNSEFKVKQFLNHFNRRLNGNYALNNKSYAQRTVVGKLTFFLRKWLEPGIRRRYRGIGTAVPFYRIVPRDQLSADDLYYSREIEDLDEGTYTTTIRFFRDLFREYKIFSSELRTDTWAKLTAREKGNVTKTVTEMTMTIISMIMGSVLAGAAADEPDEQQKAAIALGAFYARRLYSELSFYVNPIEAIRIIRSPSASINLIEKGTRFIGQLSSDLVSAEFEVYQQGARKGEFKLEKRFRDLVPIWYQTGRRVDEALGFLYKPN